MQIEVLTGHDRNDVTVLGTAHFSRTPEPGERALINDRFYVVIDVWHKPDNYFFGPKFVILCEEDKDDKRERSGIHLVK